MSKTVIAGLLLLTIVLIFLKISRSGSQMEDIPSGDQKEASMDSSSSPKDSDISHESSTRGKGVEPRTASMSRADRLESDAPPTTLESLSAPPLPPAEEPIPEKLPGAEASPRQAAFEIKEFSADEILALPLQDKQAFLEKNKLIDPDNFERFRYLSQTEVIDNYLKGQFQGKLEDKDGKTWTLTLGIDGQLEDGHFTGEMAVEMLDEDNEPVGRSKTNGPLDSHFRVVHEGNKHSFLIIPGSQDSPKMYQIFIGQDNRSMLAGNYYRKDETGKFQRSGPFILKRL